VFCKIMHRTYFHNDFIFVRPAVSTDFIESDPPAYRSYYPNKAGLRQVIRDICADFNWNCDFANAGARRRARHQRRRAPDGRPPAGRGGQLPDPGAALGVLPQQGAYIVGKAINGDYEYPFVVPVLHDSKGRLFLDAILLDSAQIRTLFSLSRAYFMVDMEVPSAYVDFLSGLMPHKPAAEIYTMLGLAKQGKTMFYRDLMHHLRHSQDEFIVAPGIPRHGHGGVHPAVLSLRLQGDQGRLRPAEGSGPRHRQGQVRAGQAARPRRAHGRHPGVLQRRPAQGALQPELLDELRRECPSLLEENDDEIVISTSTSSGA
jgi:isocitrate dehydrogenase kinase/phosphatase